jgi:hypothetical protein
VTAPAYSPPDRLLTPERQQVHASAELASRLYPGPVGELLSRELLAMAEFGYRLGVHALLRRLMRALDEEQQARQAWAGSASEVHR